MRIRFTGTSSTLPLSVRGTSAISNTRSGTWRGEHCSRIRLPISLVSCLVELSALAQDHEQRHPALGPRARDVDDQGVGDLVDRGDRAIDLRRAHADPRAVDGRVRAPVDDRRAARGDLDPVAVAPDARVGLEVRGAVARPVLVAPEEHRHRGHRLGDHQLADLVDERVAVLVPGLDRAAERAPLELAAIDGQDRNAADEGGADVGAAGGREQPGVRAERGRRPTGSPRAPAASPSSRPSAGSTGRGPRPARPRPSCSRRCSWRRCRSR